MEQFVENDKTLQPTILKPFIYTYTDMYKRLMFNCFYEKREPNGNISWNNEEEYKEPLEYIESINKYIISNTNHNNKCLIYSKKDIPNYKINIEGNGLYSTYEKSFCKNYNDINLYFTNIPKELFLECGYTHQHLNYNSQKQEFFSYMKNLKEVNEYINNVYHNGMKSPLLMQEYEGNLYPLCMRVKYFSAFYLELPSIPVCIVDYPKKFIIGKLEGHQNKDKLRDLLYPYIIIK